MAHVMHGAAYASNSMYSAADMMCVASDMMHGVADTMCDAANI